MRALAIDYRRKRSGFPWLGVLLLVVSVAAIVAIVNDYRHTTGQIAMTESLATGRNSEARRQMAINQRPRGDAQKVALETKRAGEVISQLNIPWDELFRAVESTDKRRSADPVQQSELKALGLERSAKSEDGNEVALLAIEPDPSKGQVKLTAEARNLTAMLDYVRQLQQQSSLTDVYLQNHQVQQQDAEKPVRFTLTATWIGHK